MFRSRIGLVLTGAASLIGQELALVRALLEGEYRGAGGKIEPTHISGSSSGAIAAVAINAILEARNTGSGLTWDYLEKRFLFPLSDGRIYRHPAILYFVRNVISHGHILNTGPLRKTLEDFIANDPSLGYRSLSDLPYPTWISAVNRNTGKTERFSSTNPDHAGINLVDLLMASSAIPVLFPPVRIPGKGLYIDGATGTDSTPVESFDTDRFDKLYIISPDTAFTDYNSRLRPELKKRSIVANLTFTFEAFVHSLFSFQLERSLDFVKRKENAFLFMPRVDKKYSYLDFNSMEEMYEQTRKWASENSPVPVVEYLKGS